MPIGRYKTPLVLLRYAATKDAQYGEAEKSWTAQGGPLWGDVEELTAGATAAYAANEIRADVEIRVRGYPCVDGKDRLWDQGLDFIYRVDGVRRGDNELIVAAYRLTAGEV